MVVRRQEAGYASIDKVTKMQRRGNAGRRGAEMWERVDSLGSCWSDCDRVAGRAPRSSTTEGGAMAKVTALEQAGRREECTSSSQ
jgi:hypothetical protein